jgi:DNA mismatch endonuclease (patch repair protein)
LDHVSEERRSWLMSRVRDKNTTPELKVRKVLHGMGIRFGLHASDLPGKPDIVLRKRRTAIFVHGCFWHRHAGCRYATVPKSKTAFWRKKFESNAARDRRNALKLRKAGWRVFVVWQCQTKDERRLGRKLDGLVKRTEFSKVKA